MANQNQPLLTLSTILSDPTLLVPGTSILVYDFGRPTTSPLLGPMPVTDLITRLRSPPADQKGAVKYPLAFEIPCPATLNVTLPATITNEYKLLGRAVWAAESWGNYTIGEDGKAVRSFKPVSKSKASSAESEGKIKAMEEAKEEMQKAIKYIQVATAGFGGFWKMAGLGASSFIAVQGGEGETLMRIQLLTVDLSLLSANVRAKALKDFAEKGRKWAPEKRWITGCRLKSGEVKILGPGVVYGVINIMDSVVVGGLMMRGKDLREAFRYWRVCVEMGLETGVGKVKMGRRIVDVLRDAARKDLKACGFVGADGERELEENWRFLAREAGVMCVCEGACGVGCVCVENTQRCGEGCHLKGAKCGNPFGCEEDVA